jgi:hypothetical protein
MSIHQLNLHGSEKKQKEVDPFLVRRFISGEIALEAALKLDREALDSLRRQAHALYEAGKWQACIDVLTGLSALGDVDAFDPLLMAGAYMELGNSEAAARCTEIGGQMLATLTSVLEKIEQGKSG